MKYSTLSFYLILCLLTYLIGVPVSADEQSQLEDTSAYYYLEKKLKTIEENIKLYEKAFAKDTRPGYREAGAYMDSNAALYKSSGHSFATLAESTAKKNPALSSKAKAMAAKLFAEEKKCTAEAERCRGIADRM